MQTGAALFLSTSATPAERLLLTAFAMRVDYMSGFVGRLGAACCKKCCKGAFVEVGMTRRVFSGFRVFSAMQTIGSMHAAFESNSLMPCMTPWPVKKGCIPSYRAKCTDLVLKASFLVCAMLCVRDTNACLRCANP